MTIQSIQSTGNLPLEAEWTPANDSIFFEIYDFNLVPPLVERDLVMESKTLDAVSERLAGGSENTQVKLRG